MDERVAVFWARFRETKPEAPLEPYEVFYFCDNEADADELAALVLAGQKRGTAGLVWSYEAEGERLPRVGDLSVVINWAGEPQCVIETVAVQVTPFDAVTAEFAAIEGEGDGSLAYWREGHQRFFERECTAIGREPVPDMPVVCEQFEVVFRADQALQG